MIAIDPNLVAEILELVWTGALPGREAAARNEAVRAMLEAMRRIHSRRPMRWHRPG